jgi:hypothetical protein
LEESSGEIITIKQSLMGQGMQDFARVFTAANLGRKNNNCKVGLAGKISFMALGVFVIYY